MDFFRKAYRSYCTPWYDDSPLVDLYITANWVTFMIPFLLFFVSFWHKELYTLFFSVTSFLNWLLNYLLRHVIIKEPVPVGGCTDLKYGMPSMETQQAFFVMTFFFGYILYWRRSFQTVFSKILLVGGMTLYVFVLINGQTTLGGNTPSQMVLGAILGVIFAQICQDIIFHLIYPHFPTLLNWKLVKKFGYQDNMCLFMIRDPNRVNFIHNELIPILQQHVNNKTVLSIATQIGNTTKKENDKKSKNRSSSLFDEHA
jgi:membrane-associated phospholipid phosphatase